MTEKQVKRPRTQMQTAFAHEYRKDRNATKAAIRAGSSPKSAYQQGYKWLKIPQISAYIEYLDQLDRDKAQLTREDLLNLASEIVHADPTDYMDDDGAIVVDKNSPNRRAVQELTIEDFYDFEGNRTHRKTKLKLRDPSQAAERVSKLLGLDAPPPPVRKELTFRIVREAEEK